ncbi:gluconate 2-dehydrogenase subunit 3 family protein [uncultured Arcticibacterium sp.]|uniref:gluconate 2-dehydrogenase subunit 3 family protein n=1 Tax=uncultured Arcticibacterium sp. TaxID=2173042 RepID=UPI0030FADB03
MKRRDLLKNLTLGTAAMVAIPAWAKNWSANDLPTGKILAPSDEALFIDIIDTLIPKTDTPGAIEVGVDKFVKAMIDTMHTEDDQRVFYAQIPVVDAFAKRKQGSAFSSLSTNEKVECLGMIEKNEDATLQKFFKTLKNYSIQGYTGSEWYMTEKAGYEYAPGYGHGCVDVEQ